MSEWNIKGNLGVYNLAYVHFVLALYYRYYL